MTTSNPIQIILNENNTLLGLTDVQGPGVIITLKDIPCYNNFRRSEVLL